MSAGACGSFGLTLRHRSNKEGDEEGGEEEEEEVCYPRHLYAHELRPDDSLEVEVWYTDGSRHSATCFAWCSREGGLPDGHAFDEGSDDLVGELMAALNRVEEVEFSAEPASHALSPVVAYRVEHNQVVPTCQT